MGQKPSSFKYRIDEIWSGMVVDSYYTDDEEVKEIAEKSADSLQYVIRIIHGDGSIQMFFPASHGRENIYIPSVPSDLLERDDKDEQPTRP